jgi:hypothetical protein
LSLNDYPLAPDAPCRRAGIWWRLSAPCLAPAGLSPCGRSPATASVIQAPCSRRSSPVRRGALKFNSSSLTSMLQSPVLRSILTLSPFLSMRQPAAGGCFRRGIEDGGRAARAGLATITHAGERADALLQQIVRRAHIHHLGGTGIAQRANATDEEDGVFIHTQRLVIDIGVIVLRAIKDDGLGLEGIGVFGVGEIALRGIPRRSRSSS